jgi:hypothetical protein
MEGRDLPMRHQPSAGDVATNSPRLRSRTDYRRTQRVFASPTFVGDVEWDPSTGPSEPFDSPPDRYLGSGPQPGPLRDRHFRRGGALSSLVRMVEKVPDRKTTNGHNPILAALVDAFVGRPFIETGTKVARADGF